MTMDDVSVVMTTYANEDFTRASVWALRRFYPDIRIVFADGHNGTTSRQEFSVSKNLGTYASP